MASSLPDTITWERTILVADEDYNEAETALGNKPITHFSFLSVNRVELFSNRKKLGLLVANENVFNI